jgi:hypothetical protein
MFSKHRLPFERGLRRILPGGDTKKIALFRSSKLLIFTQLALRKTRRLEALLAPLVVLLVKRLQSKVSNSCSCTQSQPSPSRKTTFPAPMLPPLLPNELTLGRLTLGMITSLRALGASLRGLLVSPCGWYWYAASRPVFQGSVLSALPILFSLLEEVGLELKCQPARPKAPDMIARRTYETRSGQYIALSPQAVAHGSQWADFMAKKGVRRARGPS